MSNNIVIKGNPTYFEDRVAGEDISTGDLVKLNASGNIAKHSGAGTAAQTSFAVEEIGKVAGEDYKSGDTIRYCTAYKGCVVMANVLTGAGAIVIGDAIMSAGNGTVKKAGSTNFVIGYALEALNNTSGSTQQLKIEVT